MNKQNIYTVGGTVQAGTGLYIPRKADKDLLDLCRNGDFAYVLTPRQLGKSSLMVRTAQQLREENIHSLIVDLTEIGIQVSAEAWYLGLLVKIEDQLSLRTNVVEWWETHSKQGLTQRLTTFFGEVLLEEIEGRIVIFVDEIDTTLSLTFTDDFFAAIRYFYNARAYNPKFKRLSFVLIGVATPGDLIRDPKRTPFNIGQRVDLTDFSFEEALPLASGLGLPDSEARSVLRHVLTWTGGHPYLTQRLCGVLASDAGNGSSKHDIDRTVTSTFFGEKSKQDDNLRFVRDMLTERFPSNVSLSSVITTYRGVRRGSPVSDEEQSLVKSHLKLSGIVFSSEGLLRVRNAIYREVFDEAWIKLHLPINWTRRLQRAAAGLIATLLLLAFPLGSYAWYQRNQALNQANKAVEALRDVEHQKQIAEKSRLEAEEARKVAEIERERAQSKSEEAEEQRQLAEEQRHLAESRTREAEQLRNVAEDRRVEAEQLRQISDARGMELKANLALSDGDSLGASVLLAHAIQMDDNKDRRARLLELRSKTEPTADLVWSTPDNMFAESAIFTSSGYIVVGNRDGTIRFYHVASGREEPRFNAKQEGAVTAIANSPNETQLIRGIKFATGSSDNSIYLWDRDSKKVNTLNGHTSRIIQLAFSLEGGRLASLSNDGMLLVWDLATGQHKTVQESAETKVFLGPIYFSSDGNYINLLTGTRELSVSNFYIGPARRSFDEYGYISFHNLGNITAGALHNKSFETAAGRSNGLVQWSGHILKLSNFPITNMEISPDNQWLLSVTNEGILHLLERKYGQEIMKLPVPVAATNVEFSPTSNMFALRTIDGRVQLWEVNNKDAGHLLFGPELLGHVIETIAFSPNGEQLILGRADGKILILNSKTGKVEQLMAGHTVSGKSTNFPNAIFTTDRSVLASFNEFKISVRDLGSDKELWNAEQQYVVSSIAFSSDGRQLASATDDSIIRIWNTRTGKELFNLSGHKGRISSLIFDPTGQLLASVGQDQTVVVWDITRRKEVFRHESESPVTTLAFSGDGKLLACGRTNKTIRIWAMPTGSEIALLSGLESSIKAMAFSPDTHWLASVSNDTSFRMWDINRIKEFFAAPSVKLVERAEYRSSLTVRDLELVPISPNTSSPYAEMGRTVYEKSLEESEEDNARLDNFAVSLEQDHEALAYIVVYSGSTGNRASAEARAERSKLHLVNERHVTNRIVTTYGGIRLEPQMELWVVPRGASLPELTPTVRPQPTPDTTRP